MKFMNWIQRIALSLVIVGAINWGLIGIFNFDLVATLFGGQQSFLSRIIYSLVGFSGLYALTLFLIDKDVVDTGIATNNIKYGTEFSSEFDNNLTNKDTNDDKRI